MDFITRVLRSRRVQHARWSASLAAPPPAPPAGVPVSAWITPQSPRRRRNTTERVALKVEPLHWQYIAPTVAAVIPAPRARFTWFDRKIQLPLRLEVYPPPTGPPNLFPAFEPSGHHRRRETSRELRFAESAPFRQLTPALYPSFEPSGHHRRHDAPRRALRVEHTPTYPATVLYPSIVPTGHHSRRETTRSKLVVDHNPAYPATVRYPAHEPNLALRRRETGRTLRISQYPPVYPFTPPPATPAVYPSFEPTGFHRRRETERRALEVLSTPFFPPTPAAFTGYPGFERGQTRVRRGTERRIQREPEFITGNTAQPETAWRLPLANHVEYERRLLQVPLHLEFPPTPTPTTPAVYPSFVPSGFLQRRATSRKLLPADAQLETPATPPIGEQPEPAWKLPVAFRTEFHRRHLRETPLASFPLTYTIDGGGSLTLGAYGSVTLYSDGNGHYFTIARV